jgi:hypothetical protein
MRTKRISKRETGLRIAGGDDARRRQRRVPKR